MQIAGHRERQALALADAEYRRRNSRPIPVVITAIPPYWAVQAHDGEEIDAYAYEEARALMAEALKAPVDAAQGHPSTPWQRRGASDPFWMVPSAAKRRHEAAGLPWWKRIFAGDHPPASSVPPLPAGAYDPFLRQINQRLAPQPEDGVVYDKPVRTTADLDDLLASATAEWPASPPTVSGGGPGRIGVPPGVPRPSGGTRPRPPTKGKGGEKELLEYVFEITNAQASDLTPQQYLQIAIEQRNALVAEGASKTLISHWNREIRDLNAVIRRMP